MDHSSPTSPFEYDAEARRVRSVDPAVRIVGEMFEGGSDGYRAHAVAISRGLYLYCLHAVHDYLKDPSGKSLLTPDGRPLGVELTNVQTRWRFRDRSSGEYFASTFPDDDESYRAATELAVGFYSSAKMLRQDAPIRRIEFDRTESVEPKVVEVSDAL